MKHIATPKCVNEDLEITLISWTENILKNVKPSIIDYHVLQWLSPLLEMYMYDFLLAGNRRWSG